MITTLTIIVLLVLLTAAAYKDLKTLEIPDWISFSGVTIGLGVNSVYSVLQSSWSPIIAALSGLAIAFAISSLMYYTGQWGGGDAKLLLAVGAVSGTQWSVTGFSLAFIMNLVILGAVWGLLFTLYVGIKNANRSIRFFRALRAQSKFSLFRITTSALALVFIIISIFAEDIRVPLLFLALTIFLLGYLVLLIKSVELAGMYKWVKPQNLTEGDWLVHEISKDRITVKCSRTGLTTEQLSQLRKMKPDRVCVKYGVPFTPAFLLSFIVSLTAGNLVLFAISL